MKAKNRFRPGHAIALAVLCGLFELFAPALGAAQQLKPELAPLGYFIGDWQCSGKFDSSGKSIEARQHFAPDLDGSWILFRHDDQLPFSYHALSQWGWDSTRKTFIMTAQDSAGGLRIFRSEGWNSSQLQWDGDGVDSTADPAQRFVFERINDRTFKVSYFTRKAENWSRIDSSNCSKR